MPIIVPECDDQLEIVGSFFLDLLIRSQRCVWVVALFGLSLLSLSLSAQQVGDVAFTPQVLIKQGPSVGQTFVPRPEFMVPAEERSVATFVVNYTGFSPEAQAAFQYAVDIWSDLLTASIPIVIDADWIDLPGNVLGAAGAYTNYSLTGADLPLDGAYYPVGLANQLVGFDIEEGNPDIIASFDSGSDWYLGTDGNPGLNQIDFVSVVLHEIGHGLGFSGSASWNEDGTGSFLGGTTLFVFDNFVELGEGTSVGSLSSDAPALGGALISDNLFWNGAHALAASSSAIKMYAPDAWSGGSSYSHFDEATYGAGDPASLMTPQIGWGEAIHDPGAMALGLLSDIGWTSGYPVTNNAPVANDQFVSTDEDTPKAITMTGSDVEGSALDYTVVVPPSNGFLSGIGNSRTYSPNNNFNGSDSFTFRVNDGELDSELATVTITVNPVNDAPVANDQFVTTDEDVDKLIVMTGSDIENSALDYTVVVPPSNGSLSGIGDSRTYSPNNNFNGSDSFTFRVNDGELDSELATVTITVNPVNDAPVANDQFVTTDEDTPKAITMTGSDVEGSALDYTVVVPPSNGFLSGIGNSRTYSPNNNFNGSDSFTFRVNDGELDSELATVTITVNPVNDAPVANDQFVTTDEDVDKLIVMTGSDIENSALDYTVVVPPSNGSLSGIGDSRTYSPNNNFNGSDSFTFRVNDGELDSELATVTITVNPVNDAPVANDQFVTTDEDTPKAITMIGSDIENSALDYTVVVPPSNGFLSGIGNSRTYSPNNNFNGSDSFTFRVNDGELDSELATVTITVNPVNDAPVANDQFVTTDEDVDKLIVMTGSDIENSALDYTVVVPPSNGSLSGIGDSRTYSPNNNFNGSDSFTFRVNDGELDSELATVTITVNPVNDAPVANDQFVTTDEDTPKAITMIGSDIENSALDYTVVVPPSNGFLSGIGNSRTYSPNNNFNGSDSFTFRVNDGELDSELATVTITVNPVNDAPVANDQFVTTDEDVDKLIVMTGSDIENSALDYTVVVPPSNGSLSGIGDSRTYSPNNNFNGSDSFTFRVNDGELDSELATVTITVNPVNDAPVANDQFVTTDEDTPKAITMIGSDIENSALDYTVVVPPSNGFLSGIGNSRTYSPNNNFNGSDSFTFRVNDGELDSELATVTITVNPVNDAPVANDQFVTTDEDVDKLIVMTGSDIENSALDYTVVVPPSNGSLSGIGDSRTYSPNNNFNGSDSFTFRVNDGELDSELATVTITVLDVDGCNGAIDECGVCNGPGAIYGCGCYDVPQGDCDCFGNQLDAAGVCGGSCIAVTTCPDLDQDGFVGVTDILIVLGEFGAVCEPSVFGCTLSQYLEYNPAATVNDGSCSTLASTCVSPSMDGCSYGVVEIGDQCWFAENLRTTVYADGSAIPEVTDVTAWAGLSTGVRCDYDNDVSNVATYGRLYNWYAAADAAGLCPTGWHVPTDDEWTALENFLGANGHSGAEGTALKATSGWGSGSGTDDFGFSALPGGFIAGYFGAAGNSGYWWSSSPIGGLAWARNLSANVTVIFPYFVTPRDGHSVRCLRDAD